MPASVWETVFMLVVLKIPVVYLCAVVWWAIRAEPPHPPADGELGIAAVPPAPPCDWHGRERVRRRRAALRRRPARRPSPRPGLARAEARS